MSPLNHKWIILKSNLTLFNVMCYYILWQTVYIYTTFKNLIFIFANLKTNQKELFSKKQVPTSSFVPLENLISLEEKKSQTIRLIGTEINLKERKREKIGSALFCKSWLLLLLLFDEIFIFTPSVKLALEPLYYNELPHIQCLQKIITI